MSAYVEFYLKNAGKFLPIGSFSRSGSIYAAFQHVAPWEKACAVTSQMLEKILHEQYTNLEGFKNHRAEVEARKATIATFNNSVEDKMQALADVEETLSDLDDTIDELQYALDYIRFLSEILDAVDPRLEEYGGPKIDPDKYLYCGIECGFVPEIEE